MHKLFILKMNDTPHKKLKNETSSAFSEHTIFRTQMADLRGSDDYNLQRAWDEVCQSFAKTTKVDLTITPRYTIDQVLDQIRQKQDDDEQRNVKYKVAKDVISKTLSCIEVLGGIAAQGASMVCHSLIR